MRRTEIIKKILPVSLHYEASRVDFQEVKEVRLRVGKPCIFVTKKSEEKSKHLLEEKELGELVEYLTNYSRYAYENELRQGYLTIEGGHRVGVAGQVLLEGGQVKNIKHISSVNIRVAHEMKGCANKILPFIKEKQVFHTLIISPPGGGKTTLLRDCIRQLSNEYQVGVVDERSELAACYKGVPQNDLGPRTDVLDGCPKIEGMLMLIRAMAPDILAVDEIGSREDMEAVKYAMRCGVKVLATIHGQSLEEVLERMEIENDFERYIVLENKLKVGEVAGVYDQYGALIRGR